MNSRLLLLLLAAGMIGTAVAAPRAGDSAPAFQLEDQNGDCHRLADYRGKWLAIYFYPKDDTPGCTTEACNFRDNIYAFRRIGADILGVSLDDVDSHKAFADKYRLPFVLLADPAGDMVRAYGAMRPDGRYANRVSYLIDPEGIVVKHYAEVDPETHTDEVLADIERFQAERNVE